MGLYTETLEDLGYDLIPEDEGYDERLRDSAKLFRPFDEAMDVFIAEHGYEGDIDNPDEKARFIAEKFKAAGIDVPRNLKKWYSEHMGVARKTAFEICFAFGLDVSETRDFFRRVCLDRSFDYHDMTEIVYYFCIDKGLGYNKANEMISKLPDLKTRKEPGRAVIYTENILSDIEEIDDGEELIDYLTEHKSSFGYNNATACKFIREFWVEISGVGGLAAREKERFYTSEDDYEPTDDDKKKKAVKADKKDSLWKVYLQIMGLSGRQAEKLGTDRSLKPLLSNQAMLHPLAENCFPDRDGLNKILNREHVSHERVRKTLILLGFYRYWVRLALDRDDRTIRGGDMNRFQATMDNLLLDAGYQQLYVGNPFDWLILYSLVNSDDPLGDFRGYIQDLYYMTYEA